MRQRGGFTGNDHGALPVEFAFIIPLIFALILGVVDVSRVLLANSLAGQLTVELSNHYKFDVAPSARVMATQTDVETALESIASASFGSLVDASNLTLSVSTYDDMAAYVGNSINMGGPLLGDAGQLVSYRIDYMVDLVTPFADLLYSGENITTTATAVIKNAR
ncbi:MAG: hypothetical protein COB93_06910 [Sneathiella sp.]|nr:MAG: hypothetical protein COB93_06910 [Sneathiella sp.]